MNIIVAIPTTFTGDATPGLTFALSMARPEDRIIPVLHRDSGQTDEGHLDDEVDALTDFLIERGQPFAVRPVMTSRDIVTVLLEAIESEQAGLCVVEIPDYHATGASVLGKQAQRLILETQCSLVVARDPK